ncbi:MAG TPA: rhomboid family intramembrane serine protease [Spirochaetota bacterium]|nr:rhomboid family intramembrane serine protease [Spirochaetota bacterium]
MQIRKNLHITFLLIVTLVVMYVFYKINVKAFISLFVLKSANLSEIIPWQFITYVFYFPENIVFFFFNVMIFFYFSSTLEELWGSFHLGIYLLIVILSRSLSCFLFGPLPVIGHWSLYLCLMVAFGFNMPDERIFIFFVIPIKVKTLAIISAAFIPIQIILSMIYPSGAEGFFNLPLSIGSLISGLLSYIAILIYFSKIFGKKEIKIDKVINNLQKTIKNIENNVQSEDKRNENKKYLEIYRKKINNEDVNSDEKILIENIETQYGDLCQDDNFDENDQYCIDCDKYKRCIKRKLG